MSPRLIAVVTMSIGVALAIPVASRASETASGATGVTHLAHMDAAEPEFMKKMNQEQKMQARFPQPVRVGDLIGLPVLDDLDRTIGFVRRVTRTAAGKVQLIVPYAQRFGWADFAVFDSYRRPVAVPIEVVAILARQIAALDMPRSDFDKATTWTSDQGTDIPLDDKIKIAVTRR